MNIDRVNVHGIQLITSHYISRLFKMAESFIHKYEEIFKFHNEHGSLRYFLDGSFS